MTLYIAFRLGVEVAIAKNEDDAFKALNSKKKYKVYERSVAGLARKTDVIDYYELYALKLLVASFFNIPEDLVGKVAVLDDRIRNRLKNYRFYTVYGAEITLDDVDERLIDDYISKTKQDYQKWQEYKNRPKIYEFAGTNFAEHLVNYVRARGTRIGDGVYYYEVSNKISVIDIVNGVGISIPKDYDLNKYVEWMSKELKSFGHKDILRYIIKCMMNEPNLQDYASALVLLGII